LVVDPVYLTASMIVQGASVLHLKLAPSGSVERVEVIQALGDQTAASIEAVKKWKFIPARDETGEPVASDVFAVCIYRPLDSGINGEK
jgi:outer membrane biosynthesis protein TonB